MPPYPERARIAKKMQQKSALSVKEMHKVIQDLLALCEQDYTVFYFLGKEPVDRLCPVYSNKIER
jgi:hypothetical protein